MNFAISVLILCVLSLIQDATSSALEQCKRNESEISAHEFVPVPSGTKVYFHSLKNGNLLIGPRLASNDEVTVYILGTDKEPFTNRSGVKYKVLKSGVLVPKNDRIGNSEMRRVYRSREPTFYMKGFKGILIPINLLYSKSKQSAIIDSDAALLAKRRAEADATCGDERKVKPKKSKKSGKLIEELLSRPSSKSELVFKPKKSNDPAPVGGLAPDKNCNGEITMFILKSDGVLHRMPPDPYLPIGIQLSYTVKDNFLVRPRISEEGGGFVINYLTGKNGNLVPSPENRLRMRTENGDLVSFILGQCGSLIPVQEERDRDRQINYYYNGRLMFRGEQFSEIFSNSEFIVINDEKHKLPVKKDYSKEKKHRIRKRSVFADDLMVNTPSLPPRYYTPVSCPGNIHNHLHGHRAVFRPAEAIQTPINTSPPHQVVHQLHRPGPIHHLTEPAYEPQFIDSPTEVAIPQKPVGLPMKPNQMEMELIEHPGKILPPVSRIRARNDLYAIDDQGVKISLIPELTEENDVVLYKLTCKGNLVRYPSCKEPEFGFEIHFQLLLDEFILVPVTKNNKPMHLAYKLQENGDLIPVENNENSFKKAPGSLVYFMLGKNNVLFPVQQQVDPDGSLTFYYQDYHLVKFPSTANKPLHFSTLSRPIFAYYNGLTVITTSSKPRLNPSRGSNWKNHTPHAGSLNEESSVKDIFLSGPSGQLIRISPYRTKTGSTVLYELDSNGIFYRSPKDKKKCIILKSYILLKEGILLPSNETTGYLYMMSKNGDMFPYLYPDGKLEAPPGESLKYLLCEKGILLPMELEIVDHHICYFFRDVIVYKEKVYCKDMLDSLTESRFKLHYHDDCENSGRFCDKNCRGGIKPFTTETGRVVYYEKKGNILERNPPDKVPHYLSYTMGSFEIQPDGSLHQVRYQDPDDDVINLMLEPNGDLLEDSRNDKILKSIYYVLDINGNLISVEGRKTRRYIYFYKNHLRVCRVKLAETIPVEKEVIFREPKKTPLGRDPFKLLDDPEPKRTEDDDEPQSMYIPVPLKSVTMPGMDSHKNSKCDKIKETMALELEINDEVIEEIKNWAAKCDKLLSRREVEQGLSEALKGLNVAGLLKETEKAR